VVSTPQSQAEGAKGAPAEHLKIAIAAGHFVPEVGYQEVYLARAYMRLGHEVRVVTSDRPSPSSRLVLGRLRYEPGLTRDEDYGFSVLRLRARLHARALVLAPGTRQAVGEFQPHVVLVLGVGKLFPVTLLSRAREHRVVAIFSDNSDFWDFSSPMLGLQSLRSKVSQLVLKDWVYRRAVKNVDRICLNTLETKTIVASSLPQRLQTALEAKAFFCPLGFDPDEFFFSSEERAQGREELSVSTDASVFITCTRVMPKKSLEDVIDAISRLHVAGHNVRYVIAGFLGDAYERTLKRHIAQQPDPEIFHCFPFLDHAGMRRLYCSADIGIWLKAAISIQESMGTGLPVLVESKPSVSHLVSDGLNGWHFRSGELSLGMKRALAAARRLRREDIAAANYEHLSYDVIARELLDSVARSRHPEATRQVGDPPLLE
jgi:glycosyltransferase involved in cell wall biosynthesis